VIALVLCCAHPVRLSAQTPAFAPFTALAWRPDSGALGVGGEGALYLFSPALDVLSRNDGIGAEVSALAWAGGDLLAVGRYDGLIDVWTGTASQRVHHLRGSIGAINALAFSPDGTTLASAGDDLLVRLWQMADGTVVLPSATLKKHTNRALAVAYGPENLLISGGADNAVIRWRDGRQLPSPQGHTGPIPHIAFSPDGAAYATASADGTARLWRARDGVLSRVLRGQGGGVIAVGWQSASTVVTYNVAGVLHRWEVGDAASPEAPSSTFSGLPSDARRAAFSPDGRWLAVLPDPYHLIVLDARDGRVVAALNSLNAP
jgi:WD40 repeat protein